MKLVLHASDNKLDLKGVAGDLGLRNPSNSCSIDFSYSWDTHTLRVPDQSQHDRHGVTHQQVPFITNVCVDIIGEIDTFGICYHYISPRFVIQRDMFKPTKHFYA
jgi:hypothetical protein